MVGIKRIIDLSLPMYPGMPVFPGTDQCSITWTSLIKDVGFNMGYYTMNTHAGTHCDSPAHFFEDWEGGVGMEHWPIEKAVGPARVLDFSYKKERENITKADLLPYEEYFTPGARIFIRTDWDLHAEDGDSYFADYPGIAVDAAEWMVEKKLGLLGLDAASLNSVDGQAVHRLLLGNDVLVTESLANLRDIPEGEFFYVGAPYNYRGADGCPVRAMAILFDED